MANIYRFRNQSVAFENTITSTVSSGTNLTITNNSSSSGVPLTVFQGSLIPGPSTKTQLKLGVAATSNNTGILQFNYTGNASTSNSLGLGFEGSENLLQVSGTTISSVLPITNTISTGFNLTLTNNASSSQGLFAAYQPNLANTNATFKTFGVSAATRNSATEKFVYTSTGSTSNYYGLGLWDQDDVLVINGNQRVGINNIAPSFTLDVTGTIRATALISANLGLTVTGANTSVTTLSSSGLISANSGLTVTGGGTSVTSLSASGLISANLGLTVTGANTSVTTLSSSGLISANLGLTVTGANTSVTTLSSSGLISADLGLTVTGGGTSVTTLSASGVITSTISTGTAPFTVASTTNVANLNASSLNGSTFASPGSIGSTSAGSGAFTTLSSSGLISANLGLTVTGATTSVTSLTASELISANLGLTVTGANTSVTTLSSSGLISANLGLTVTGANTSVTTLSSSGLITANLGLTVTGANTSVTSLTASALITASLGLTVTGATTSVTTLSSSGLISANLGLTVTGANTSVTTLSSSGLITSNSGILTYNNVNGAPSVITAQNESAGSDAFILMRLVNDTANNCFWFMNSSTRTADGGANTATIRNNAGQLRLQNASEASTILLSGSLITTTALTSSGLITASAGLTVTGANTSVTTLSSSGLITTNAGLTNTYNLDSFGTPVGSINTNTGTSAHGGMYIQSNAGACVWFINSTTRTADGGVGTATLRNDVDALRLQGNGGTSTILLSGGVITTTALTSSGLITASAGLTSTAGTTTLGTTSIGLTTVNPVVVDSNAFDHSTSPVTITNSTPITTIASALPVLHLCRQGSGGYTYGSRATFDLSRYEAGGTGGFGSRTQMDIKLTNDTYNAVNIMTMRSNGNVGIGTTSPQSALHVAGILPVSPTGLGVHIGADGSNAGIQLNGGTPYIDFSTVTTANDKDARIILASSTILRIEATNVEVIGVLNVVDSATTPGAFSASILAPNMTTTNNIGTVIGKNTTVSTSNCAIINYKWVGDSNSSNAWVIGHNNNLNGSITSTNGGAITVQSSTFAVETGNVGIGTLSPGVRLDVSGGAALNNGGVGHGYLNSSGAGTFTGNENPIVSIRASHRITAAEFNVFSDRRIKTNISDVTNSLIMLRKITPRNFNYVDKISKGDKLKFGFIGQELILVDKNLVSYSRYYIPNIYQKCVVTNKVIVCQNAINFDIKGNGNIRLFDADNKEKTVTLKSKISEYSFSINETLENKEYFVFGEEITDFHIIDEAGIAALTTSAVKELDALTTEQQIKIQNQQQKIELLEKFIRTKFPGEF